jgi:membrane dipeptidase
MVIDGLQYANWSEKVFRQMREGGVDAVHVTIAYHEMFRETVANIEAWNRRFERFPDLICHAETGDDVRREGRGAHRHRLRRPDARAHRGRYRPGRDPAHARPALHAAQLQQPVAAGDRLLRGGGPRPHPHGPRGHRRDEPRGPCRRHEPFRRTLHAGGDRGQPRPIAITHANPAFWHPPETQQVRHRAARAGGDRRHAGLLALSPPPEGRQRLHACRISARWSPARRR